MKVGIFSNLGEHNRPVRMVKANVVARDVAERNVKAGTTRTWQVFRCSIS